MHTKIANYVLIDIFTIELICDKIPHIHQENKTKKNKFSLNKEIS